jgi:hypothetical protein
MSTAQLLKPCARFFWYVGFKPLVSGRKLLRGKGFVAIVCLMEWLNRTTDLIVAVRLTGGVGSNEVLCCTVNKVPKH